MQLEEKKNIGWIDLWRVLACFLVVFAHCCDPFVAQFGTNREAFLTGSLMGSALRMCVPLFVMMSGVLLLPVRTGLGEFYKKRIGRILPPLIFWSVLLPILFYLYLTYINPTTTNASLSEGKFGLSDTLTKMYTFIFNFNFDTTPMWYLYMLVGLYFVMPIFSHWLQKVDKKEIKLFLKLWGISLCLPYLQMVAPMLGYTGNYGDMGILGVCAWNQFGSFYYVSGFIGYVVLAYYLMTYPPTWSMRRTLCIAAPMFLVGFLITAGGFLWTQEVFPGDYTKLEIIWYFSSINVFMMTFAIFIIGQKLKIRSTPLLSQAASLTFGIYLCHFVVVQIAYDLFNIEGLPPFIRIIGAACLSFGVSYLWILLMKQSKLTRRLIA